MTGTGPAVRPGRAAVLAFGRQVGWSFTAKVVSAVLQLVVIVLLARGLSPSEFAWVASANVVMLAVVATNGFGLIRQIQYRRSLDKQDPTLPGLFNLWQIFTFSSAVLWLASCLILYSVTREPDFIALLPIAAWLTLEQTTALWNGISIVDDRAQDLMSSYLYRRLPVVIGLLLGLAMDWDVVWCWTLGIAFGSSLAYVRGYGRQEIWARNLIPRRPRNGEKVTFDLGYWWTEVGAQIRDLDVAVISLISASVGGVYGLPARLVKPMNLVTVATASVAFPKLARWPVVTRRQLLVGCVVGTGPVLAVSGLIAALAGFLPHVVGEEYAAAVPALRVLCIAATVSGFGALVMTFLQARSTAANRFAGYTVLGFGILQICTAGLGAYWGNATTAAWAATMTQIVAVTVLWMRAMAQCRQEARPTPTQNESVS